MQSNDDLEAAVEAGIITAAQAEDLADFARRWGPAPPPEGGEDLRFIRSFHDVFISIGLALLAFGIEVAFVVPIYGGSSAGAAAVGAGAAALAAAAMWALAEYFARVRRLVLPAMVIAAAFTAFALQVPAAPIRLAEDPIGLLWTIPAAALLGAAAFTLRFRLPFGLALLAGAATALAFTLVKLAEGKGSSDGSSTAILACGIAAFAGALAFDMSDPGRRTRRADNAFWLHIAAAPLIVHGLLILLFGDDLFAGDPDAFDAGSAGAMLAVVFTLAAVALAINRRALIVSALGFSGIAIATLVNRSGAGPTIVVALTLLLLGGGVVLLGAAWQGARRSLLRILPRAGAWSRVFPPEQAPGA